VPNTADEWLTVAEERGRDAAALKGYPRELAAIYMMGYVVECHLKAYLRSRNAADDWRGRAGHDLLALWENCGFKRLDVSGNRRLFLDNWATDLRYEKELGTRGDFDSLFNGAIDLVGYVQKCRRRKACRRRK
jgi:hypothetical protein